MRLTLKLYISTMQKLFYVFNRKMQQNKNR